MLDWHFVDVQRVHLVWGALVVIGALIALELRARDALGSLLSPVMQRRLAARASVRRTIAKYALVLVAMVCAIGALMRPQARGVSETVSGGQPAADILFVLDVSRSMLAEDASPNRLARAKAEIAQLVEKLDGQRVGLVAFAGRAVPVCPLTPDHAFFAMVLSSVDTKSAGRGGTMVGQALKTAIASFPREDGAKLIVLITDGDDQDPYSAEAAETAARAGVKIVAVGLGSETGSPITLTDPKTGAKTQLMHDGKPVISKLDGELLRKLALATDGAYIPAGTAAIDLEGIMESHVRPIVRAAADKAVHVVPAERYPYLVAGALLALLAALWIGAGARRDDGGAP